MLRPEDFGDVVRNGVRRGTRRIVVHYHCGESGHTVPALVGVVVPKKQVSRATHRNRIKRRVRALLKERLAELEPGSRVIVRGLAGADGASSLQLAHDLDLCLARVKASGKNGGCRGR